jgi:hypothetical protein
MAFCHNELPNGGNREGKRHFLSIIGVTVHHLTSFHVIHLKGASNEDQGNHGSARTGRQLERDLRCNAGICRQ